jgi:hypothetical protein
MRWARNVARIGKKMNAYRILVEKKRNKPLGRPGRKWVNNIKMNLGNVGWGGIVGALANAVMNLRIP